ncbi:MAG: hypothetical protein AB7Q37_14730 [Pyrinomonadaceae bacterium]
MERDKKLEGKEDLFVQYSDEINKAYKRAVREALLMHKRARNPVAVRVDGKLVILQPDEIPTE